MRDRGDLDEEFRPDQVGADAIPRRRILREIFAVDLVSTSADQASTSASGGDSSMTASSAMIRICVRVSVSTKAQMLLANSIYAYCSAGIAGTNRRDRAFNRQEALCPAPQSLDWSAPHF
jgi:hypothetical protein